MKKEEYKYSFIKPFVEHLKDLILKTEQELVNMRIQEWVYTLEYHTPVYLGKADAEYKMGEYQKRARYLEENIEVYKKYANEHGINL